MMARKRELAILLAGYCSRFAVRSATLASHARPARLTETRLQHLPANFKPYDRRCTR